jgi:hypothetical protein
VTAAVTQNVYVYGVIGSDAEVDLDEAGLGPVRVVAADDVSALCSDVPEGDLVGRRRELKAHADVLGAACMQTTVVPLSFGTLLPDDEAVRTDLLNRHADHLVAELKRLGGLLQFNVRLVPVEERLLADVVAGSPELTRLRDSVRAAGSRASQAQQMRLGEAANSAYRAAADRIGHIMVESFSRRAVDARVEQVGGADATTRAVFLVERTRLTEFLDEAQQFADSLRGRVTCRVVGPLPAFSFVEPFGAGEPVRQEARSWVS